MRSDFLAAFVGTAIVMTAPAVASPTTFTYQGHLAQDGTASDGAYEFEIRLLDNLGVQIGMTQTASEIVTEGQFSMELDFGNGAFDSNERYLEISVRSVVDGGAYTMLSPNQLVTSAPVAQFAINGNEGPQGPAGSQGNQGAQGDPGTPGADGSDGGQGPQGDPGIDGRDGAPGAQGPQGDQGVAGAAGDSHWSITGGTTYYTAGNVGIGTIFPIYPLHVETSSVSGRAIYGSATATAGLTYGGRFESGSSSGRGVYGLATAATGTTFGVRGETNSPNGYAGYFEGGRNYFEGNVGIGTNSPSYPLDVQTSSARAINSSSSSTAGTGVYGEATASAGFAFGVYGRTFSNSGRGVFGWASRSTGTTYGVFGLNSSTSGTGLYGIASASTGTTYGVRGSTSSPDGYAGYFEGGSNYFEGNVGVGTSSPQSKLDISVPGGGGLNAFNVSTNGSMRMRVYSNGGIVFGGGSAEIGPGNVHIANKLGIKTLNPLFDISVEGTAGKSGGGTWSIFSDARLKKNINSMTGSLDTISALRPVSFEYKAEDHFSYTPGVQRGFIAQEVQKVIPQWVNTADDGYFYLDQVGYEALIVDAIQELRAEKDAEIEKLRVEKNGEIQELKARLDRLERMMVLIADK